MEAQTYGSPSPMDSHQGEGGRNVARVGVHRSVAQLKTAIREFIAAHHAKATRFAWTKSADEILASIARFAQRTLDFQAAPLIVRTTRSGH